MDNRFSDIRSGEELAGMRKARIAQQGALTETEMRQFQEAYEALTEEERRRCDEELGWS